MSKRAVAVLLALSVMLSATPWEEMWARVGPLEASAASIPGQDRAPSTDNDLCPDSCLCLCCHTSSLVPPEQLGLASPVPADQSFLCPSRQGTHSSNFFERIYHPPRLS